MQFYRCQDEFQFLPRYFYCKGYIEFTFGYWIISYMSKGE